MNAEETTKYIIKKYRVDLRQDCPIYIQGGRKKEGLVGLFRRLGFTVGAEIGVGSGRYSAIMCENIPGLKLYCVDSWCDLTGYRDHRSQEYYDRKYEATKARLAPYGCVIIQALSMDAVKQFEDESLDFVFIDANHEFQHCTNDIAEWSKKVRPGGIVSGHDYFRFDVKGEHIDVVDVVNGWTRSKKINPWFVFTGDKGPCWFWVKR